MATKTTAGVLRDTANMLNVPVNVSAVGDGFANERDVTHVVTFGSGESAVQMAIVARTEDALNSGAWRYCHGNASDGRSTFKTLAEYVGAIQTLAAAPAAPKRRTVRRSK